MSIENRIGEVDLNKENVDSNYRATIHKKFSESEISPEALRQIIFEEIVSPLDSDLTRKLFKIREGIYSVFPSREIVTLSPMGASGLDQYLTKTSPLKIAHVASRPTDIVADPTIQLAAEVYRRRRNRKNEEISIGASQMCTRLQKYSNKSLKPVFEMFGTLDSRIGGSDGFESETVANLIAGFIELFSLLDVQASPKVVFRNLKIPAKLLGDLVDNSELEAKVSLLKSKLPDTLIGVLPTDGISDSFFDELENINNIRNDILVMRKAAADLRKKIPDIDVGIQLDRVDGLGHYTGLAFSVNLGDTNIADGGTVDWVEKLSSNSKERTVVSGLGTQLLAGFINK